MRNDMDQLIVMGREAYTLGEDLVKKFEKENPEYAALIGQPLLEQYRAEVLSYLLYLSETAGGVDERRARFIQEILHYPYKKVQLNELMHRLQLHDQNFSSLIPTSLNAAVQYDRAHNSRKAGQSMVRLMDRLGEAFRLYAYNRHPMEEMDQRIYILSLTNWLQDQESEKEFKVTSTNMPKIPDLSHSPKPGMPQTAQKEESSPVPVTEPTTKSFEELMEELNSLVGLESVKKDVQSLANLLKVKQLRKERNMSDIDVTMHLVFTGNPGTGKTTVARLLAQIYHAVGALSKGQLVEVDRSDLVGGYVGQTAIKTKDVIEKALGGVLFIDEAYSLASGRDKSDFGYEAINTLLVEMENNRDDLVVITAGYPDLMEDFLQSNPGLKSRFNKFIDFPDYTPQEMQKILELQARKNGYELQEETKDVTLRMLSDMYEKRDRDFANGRTVRNFFEKAMVAQANRLSTDPDITNEELVSLLPEDFDPSLAQQPTADEAQADSTESPIEEKQEEQA